MRFGSFRAWAAPPLVYRPRLNPLSPLARGVRYVYLPIDGLRATNLVSGGPLTPAGTTSIEVDRGSLAWYSSGGVNGLDSPADVVLSAPISMGVVFRPTTPIVFSTEDVCSYHRAGSLGSRNAVGLRSYFGSISAYSVNNSGTLVKDDAPGTPLNDRPNAALGVFRSATYRRAWLNGRAGPGNTTSSMPLARETLSLSSGAGTTRSTGHAGRYYLAVVWDRELSEAEALAWTRDPWQMFLASPSVGLWAPGAVGGGGITGAVAAGTTATAGSAIAGTQTHVGVSAPGTSATAGSAPAGTQTHQGAVAAGASATAGSTPAGTSAYAGAVAAGASATAGSVPSGTQVHAGVVAAAVSATVGSAPAGTQVHVGAVAAGVSATLGSTVAGGGDVYSGTVAAGASATLGSAPAGTQTHVGTVAAGASATVGASPTGTQVHQGVVAAGVSVTVGSTVEGGGSVYSGAVAAGATATAGSAPAGTQSHVGVVSTSIIATLGSAPAGTQIYVGAVAAGVSATVGGTLGAGGTASAAEVWGYTLANGLTAEETVVAIHAMLMDLHLIHGLTSGSPLTVSTSARAAGAVSQTVGESSGTVTVTRV